MAAVLQVGERARAASRLAQTLSAEDRQRALAAVYEELVSSREEIEAANNEDCAAAQERGVDAPLAKRLVVTGRKYDAMLANVESVRSLPDPVGVCTLSRRLDEGLELYRVTTPIGVLAIVYEARPEAGVQIASLAIKSANAVILKGGSEAERSNTAIAAAIRRGLSKSGYPEDAVQLLSTREEVAELLKCEQHVDLVIPRGSNALVRYIQGNTKIPVMGHADGLCSVYVDDKADAENAVAIVVDAKTQYPAVCNAAETLLISRGCMNEMLPKLGNALKKAGVELRACKESMQVLADADVSARAAEESDYDEEFLDLRIAVKVVSGVDEAIAHINAHGSGHTDVIVTECETTARKFMAGVDAAGVFHNVSSRFADGFRYGFGAEVGISTHRTHARGPVGVDGLLCYKYKMIGSGHVVRPYADSTRDFKHEDFDLETGKYKTLIN